MSSEPLDASATRARRPGARANPASLDPAPRARTRRFWSSKTDLIDVFAVAALIALGLYGFRPLFGGVWWAVAGGAGLAAGCGIGWVGARRRLPLLVTTAAVIVAYVVLSGVARPDDALGRLAPTPVTVSGALADAIRGWPRVLSTQPPVGTAAGLVVLPMLCGLVGGALGVSLVLRTRRLLLGLIAPLGVLAVSILFGRDEPASLILQGTAFGCVLVSWLARREAMRRPVMHDTSKRTRALTGAAMLALAAVAAGPGVSLLPRVSPPDRFILRDRSEPPIDERLLSSPLNSFHKYHQSNGTTTEEGKDQELFTVTGLPAGGRLRLAVMDTYDGVVWNVSGATGGSNASGSFERVGDEIEPLRSTVDPSTPARVTVTVVNYLGVWLPGVGIDGGAAGQLRGVAFEGPRATELANSYRVNRSTDTGIVPVQLTKGDVIVLDALVPAKLEDVVLAGSARATTGAIALDDSLVPPPANAKLSAYLGTEESPTKQAADGGRAAVSGTAGGPYTTVTKLARGLREEGYYSDGTERPSADNLGNSPPGHSVKRLTDFLSDKTRGLVGNAEQYAATLALMAQTSGEPTRVVMGLKPKDDSGDPITFTGADMSAWVEVNLDGHGWVAIADPTPDKSKAPVAQPPDEPSTPTPDVQTPPPPAVPDPDAQLTKGDDVAEEDEKTDEPDCTADPRPLECPPDKVSGGLPRLVVAGAAVIGAPLLLFALFAAAVVGLKARRRKRRRLNGPTSTRIAGGWMEVIDLARDVGAEMPAHATRRESARLVEVPGSVALAERADAAVFGPGDPHDGLVAEYWAEVDDALRALLQPLGPIQRLKARVRLTSLRRASATHIDSRTTRARS
jgi:hypothetical protein